MITGSKVGIPVEQVGQRIKKLNEVLIKHGMALKADTEIGVTFHKDEKAAISLKLEVYLFGETE